jgi:tRNA G46 methylase TrmB
VLAIGVDAAADNMRDASRHAARGGLSNALFLAGDATQALTLMQGRVDEVRITLPWGSLLRAVLAGERAFALAVAGAL